MPETNAYCVLCGRRRPRTSAVEAGLGRAGLVRVLVCKECARNPESGPARRQAAREKRERLER